MLTQCAGSQDFSMELLGILALLGGLALLAAVPLVAVLHTVEARRR
ncbi:hypothetical protein GCM10022247_16180 [Allokutzneria multivorans]|uniref:Uncharacterized protein n=1 Tax=Allokutzneria multivorans TaxID=1142134 RepID=A0ABP7RFZ4_9PSEU